MRHLPSIHGFGFSVLLVAAGLPATGRAVDLQNLLQTSPFGAVNPAGTAAAAPSNLEFRGVFADKGEYFFSLYETSTHKGLWVGLNEAGNPFTARTYDAGTDTLTVDYQGKSVSLTLKRAKIIASAPVVMPPPPSTPAGNAGMPVQVTPPPPGAPLVPDAQIAEDIRRRRAMRQQSVPPGQPAPAEKPGGTQQP